MGQSQSADAAAPALNFAHMAPDARGFIQIHFGICAQPALSIRPGPGRRACDPARGLAHSMKLTFSSIALRSDAPVAPSTAESGAPMSSTATALSEASTPSFSHSAS